MNKTIKGILGISILLVLTLGSAGCTLTLSAQDLTPSEQPTWAVEGPFMRSLFENYDDLYYPDATLAEIGEADQTFAHWFFLETKPINVTNVKAFITVNGIEYPMQEYSGSNGQGLWTYQPESMCTSVYDYHYRVRYKRGWYGTATKTIGSAEAPLHSEVAEFGSLVWFVRDEQPSASTYGVVELWTPEFYDRPEPWEDIIYIQHFQDTATPLRIAYVGFLLTVPPSDEAKFEIFKSPSIDQELACGDYVEIGVRWHPESPDSADDAHLVVNVEGYHDGIWRLVKTFQIDLHGRLWQPQ